MRKFYYVCVLFILSIKPRIWLWGSVVQTTQQPLPTKELALTLPTSGSHSVGIVRLRTKATEFVLLYVLYIKERFENVYGTPKIYVIRSRFG
jgi:hypothetical protein